jgi:hypothetical protein
MANVNASPINVNGCETIKTEVTEVIENIQSDKL